jgi:hypothetical protein
MSYPQAIQIETPRSHTGTSQAASMMFAVMIGQFAAILALISAANRPRFALQRSFRRCVDGFLQSAARRVPESVQSSAKTAPSGDRWTISGRQIGQDCRKPSNHGSGHHRFRPACPILVSSLVDPDLIVGAGSR